MPEPRIATKRIIEQIFDEVAPGYNRTGPSIFTQFGEHLINQIPLAPNACVLDIATGSGAALLPVARRLGPDGRIIGIDLSEQLLKEAERAVHAEGLTHVELNRMDAEQLKFPDQTFDVVTCAFAIHLFPDQGAALGEMYRVCKPGGYLGVSLWGKNPLPFSPGWPILAQQFAEYQVGVQMPNPHACSLEDMNDLLSRNMFQPVQISSELYDVVLANIEEFWAFILTMGTPKANLMNMNAETQEKFKNEYLAKLHPMLRPDGLHMSVSVVYALARR